MEMSQYKIKKEIEAHLLHEQYGDHVLTKYQSLRATRLLKNQYLRLLVFS